MKEILIKELLKFLAISFLLFSACKQENSIITPPVINTNVDCKPLQTRYVFYTWTLGIGNQRHETIFDFIYENDQLKGTMFSDQNNDSTREEVYFYEGELLDSIKATSTVSDRTNLIKYTYDNQNRIVDAINLNRNTSGEILDTFMHIKMVYGNAGFDQINFVNSDSYHRVYKSPITHNVDSTRRFNASGPSNTLAVYEYDDKKGIYSNLPFYDLKTWSSFASASMNNATRYTLFESTIYDVRSEFLYNDHGFPIQRVNFRSSNPVLHDTLYIEYTNCD